MKCSLLPVRTPYTHLKINWLPDTMEGDTKKQICPALAGGGNILYQTNSKSLV